MCDTILVIKLPYIKKQNLLKRVQRGVTKHIPTLLNLLYEELSKQLKHVPSPQAKN